MFRRSLVLAGALALALAGLVPGAGSAAQAATPQFPVTITAANGKVTIRQAPRRIVSLSPTTTESLFAIGAGAQVVAVDDQSDYPRSAPKTTLSGFTPNVEAVASYRPDLVIISYDPRGFAAALAKLGIPVVVHGAVKTLPGSTEQNSAILSLISLERTRSVRQSRMSGWIPISRSFITLCWVGLVFTSCAVWMYGTRVRCR